MMIDSGFCPHEFFKGQNAEIGLRVLSESILNTDYSLGECLVEGIAAALTDDFQHDDDFVYDFLDDEMLTRILNTEYPDLDLQKLLKLWQDYIDIHAYE